MPTILFICQFAVTYTKLFLVIVMLFPFEEVDVAGHVAHMRKKNACSFSDGKFKEISDDLDIDLRIILERILK